jgi:hypothetical protein
MTNKIAGLVGLNFFLLVILSELNKCIECQCVIGFIKFVIILKG